MKKVIACILGLAMLLGAFGACAEAELTFDQLAGLEWTFSSGAGGWSTDMRIAENGDFSGEFHDSEMGEVDDAYPNGTLYYAAFTGQLSILEQVDEYSWKVRVDSLSVENVPGDESIDDGIRYVATDPYGISEGDEMTLYRPGTPVDGFTEDMLMWAHLFGEDAPAELTDWFMYSEKNESGFVSYATEEVEIANPWTQMTEDELAEVSGVSFNLPEGAENAVYMWLESDSLAEIQFTMDGDEYCARVKPDDLEVGQLDNISGMYFSWDHEEEITVGHCSGTIGLAQTGSEDFVELCLWYDPAPGLMYSLSVYTIDPDGLDLTAVAANVFPAAQGDA